MKEPNAQSELRAIWAAPGIAAHEEAWQAGEVLEGYST